MVNIKAVKRQRRQGKIATRTEQERQINAANKAISTRQINAANRTEILTSVPGTLHVLKVQTGVLLGKDYYSIGYIENYDYGDELTELNYVTCIL
jgi:hypothetical protein